ncbi:MAG: M20 family metallopeptidase [Deltaproteobacteria bacterium]|nr:M20 family metallopeptidase [Deltaproteobacteria bacterium]
MRGQISSYVESRQGEILDFLSGLVKKESPSHEKDHVDAVIDDLESAYKDLGFTTRRLLQERYGAHLVADFSGGGGQRVLLVGHADTVYSLGTLDKTPLKRDGERLMGPGVHDMKGGLTAMLFGIRALLGVRGSLGGSLRVVVNSDEEPGSPTSRGLWPKLTRDVNWAFVLEPAKADGAMVLHRKGVGIFRLHVKGKSAHAGVEPEKGASAIRVLARKILDMEALADLSLGTTVNTGVVQGGTQPYVVPEEARAEIDIRVPTLAEQERILTAMRALVEREDLPGTSASLEGQFHRPPMEPVQGLESLQSIVEDEGHALGLPVRWTHTGGASDGNNISAVGVPTIDGMGPAGGRAHSPDEYMDIPSLFQKTILLATVLNRLVGE